ncbi:unnamed protein product [Leptidea sinapis]|uniref:Uncharacterized protein n=1 Tax=Leptidea sinapis TaxID=189913 RepID=A0A5E4QJB7_9NEOP|nr:unnamed protein product [Leptidea sinapis]
MQNERILLAYYKSLTRNPTNSLRTMFSETKDGS